MSRGLRFRLTVLPSRLGSLFAALRRAGAELLAQPGQNLLHAGFAVEEGDEERVAVAFSLVAEAAAGGGFVLEEAPAWAWAPSGLLAALALGLRELDLTHDSTLEAMPLGYAQAGVVTRFFGPQATLVTSGLAAAAIGLAAVALLREVRGLR